MHQLLQRRNDIAHGSAKDGLNESDYISLEQAVSSVVDDVVKAISNAVSGQAYLVRA
jgi:hypothetical protein